MKDNWNLELLYKSRDDWKKELDSLDADINELGGLKGKLNTLEAFKKYIELDKKLEIKIDNLFTYSSLKHDMNQKDNDNAVDYNLVYAKYNELIAKSSFIDPEILANGSDKVLAWCDSDPELMKSIFNMKKLFRMNKYIKDAKSEELMANYNQATSGFNRLYDQLTVVDNTSKKVKVSTGETLDITEANYRFYLAELKNQKDRKKVFEAVFKFYFDHKATLAGIYDGIMQTELADLKNRGFDNLLQARLYGNNIPESVFHSLIKVASKEKKPLRDYLKIRKQFFKLKSMKTYDRFLSFAESNKKYSYEEGKKMVLEALQSVMGDEFYNKACQALEDGRVSVYPADGKASGAYSTSTYTKGTFILLNHTQTIDDVFTLAHECGHSIHSLYSIEAQPLETHNYQIFVAEIASTFNEALFLDYMLEHSIDKNEKIVLLQQAIDNIVGTFYRQTLFGHYEYEAHQLVEKGIPVTADALCGIMTDLYKKYYGMDLTKEQYKSCVWGYIPHFFGTPFYVYQYATSFSASMAIYDRVKNNVAGAKEGYLNMLKAGGSDYPIDIVKLAGVDLTTDAPFKAVTKRMAELVEKLKELLEM